MSGRDDEWKLGRAVAALRTVLDLSQGEVARVGGLSPDTVSDLEQGLGTRKPATLERIARGLGVSVATLDLAVAFVSEVLGGGVAPGEAILSAALERVCAQTGSAQARLARCLVEMVLHSLRQPPAGASEAGPVEPAELWARLERRTADQRLALIEEGEAFRSIGLVAFLCERSESAARDSAAQALELAELAVEVAALISGEGRRRCERFSWAFLGNAWRVSGNLRAAEAAFSRSLDLGQSEAAGDLGDLQEVRLLDLEASLRRDQRRLEEAISLLDRALASRPDGRSRGRLLVKKARTLEEVGDYEGAVELLHEATPFVEAAGDPYLLFGLRFNLAENLFQLGHPAEAERLMPEVRALVERLGNDLDRVRFGWLAGRIASALGRFEEAVAPLTATRAAFVERGIFWDTALVTLELAAVLSELGRTAEVKALAAATAPLFQAQGVARETLATLQLFVDAVEQEALTAELARRLAERLVRAEEERAAR